ncbi:Palmitoyltransferase AKR1 [Candida viswanathii]|uniref:Palmitoyltransferase n=1 Tax=Candida viswanathii TaxID=5486 RepID=A0A367YBT2_9ASCO|nr:Palmitoyltransferase AKR1 [Candida viswanathii]
MAKKKSRLKLNSASPAPQTNGAQDPIDDALSTETDKTSSTTVPDPQAIELSELNTTDPTTSSTTNDEDEEEPERASIKSTDAVLETLDSDLNTVTENKPEQPTEQDLHPDLAKFMNSCQEGNITIVKELLSSNAVQVNDTFSDGITGLHWACINNRLYLVKYLIENGADPNHLGGELKASPLHWACRNGLVYIVDYLISNSKADANLRDAQSYNSLHLAVHSSNIMLVEYLLLSCCDINSVKKVYIDEPDASNRTALHWAAYQNDIYTIIALLRFGADVTKVDDSLFIPLHWSFMKGYRSVLKTMVEAGSDIFAKNDQHKNSFDIAKDMNCLGIWEKVLIECGRDPKNNWALKKHWIQPKTGKIITFLVPYVLLPMMLNIITASQGFGIPKFIFALGLTAGGIYLLKNFVISTYLFDDKPLPKSPLLAGVFSSTAFWVILVWLYNIVPATFFHNFFANVLMAGCVGILTWSFFKAMFINPGYVPTPADNNVILNQAKELIALGKFDTDNFCVNSFVRKPLRSRYSKHNKKLIARFDHSCPWVYNDIGVRNHKIFIAFVYSLNLGISLFIYLSLQYFEKLEDGYESSDEGLACSLLGDELCFGYQNHHFHFNLLIWVILQGIWVTFLCIVQTFQILKGITTWEFSILNKTIQSNRFNHSTVPRDFGGDGIPVPEAGNRHNHSNEFQTCLNLLGIDQFILTVKMSARSLFRRTTDNANTAYDPLNAIKIPTDHGVVQNWKDFWIIGDETFRNVFYLPIEGENNLNGKVVDYYTLYSYEETV